MNLLRRLAGTWRLRQPVLDDVKSSIRGRTAYAFLGNDTAICRVLGHMLMFIDTTDMALAPHLIFDGFWERWITCAMARCLRPGMCAVDVGANLGYYSLLMANAVGPTGQVFAFEPNARMADLLARSLSVNGFLDRVRLDSRAVFSSSGENLRFYIPQGRPMNSTLVPSSTAQIADVSTIALDDVLPEKVDFIKIDVEGAEQSAWAGMRKAVANNPQLQIFLEYNAARYRDAASEFLDELLAPGFKLGFVDVDGATKPCTREHVLSQGNNDIVLYLKR